MAYSDNVIDHYENPRNVGSFDKADASIGTGMVGAPACGDVMKLQLKITDDGIIQDAKFKTYGCGSAIASSSLVTEWVKGKTLDQAMGIKNTQIAAELALPPVKIVARPSTAPVVPAPAQPSVPSIAQPGTSRAPVAARSPNETTATTASAAPFTPEVRRVNLKQGNFTFLDSGGRLIAKFMGLNFDSSFRTATARRFSRLSAILPSTW